MKKTALLIALCAIFTSSATMAAGGLAAKPVKVADSSALSDPPAPPVLDSNKKRYFSSSSRTKDEQKEHDAEVRDKITKLMGTLSPEAMAAIMENAVVLEKMDKNRPAPKEARTRDVFWKVGDQPIEIKMASGFSTSVLFFAADGVPMIIEPEPKGIHIGSKAVSGDISDHQVDLSVDVPWRSTNMRARLIGLTVPIDFTLVSELDADKKPVDYQVRVRVQGGSRSYNMLRPDIVNMDDLTRLSNNLGVSANFIALPIIGVERGSVGGDQYTKVGSSVGEFYQGPDGKTYVHALPGFRLIGMATAGQMTGPDGSVSYLVTQERPRVFTLVDRNGASYRVLVQR